MMFKKRAHMGKVSVEQGRHRPDEPLITLTHRVFNKEWRTHSLHLSYTMPLSQAIDLRDELDLQIMRAERRADQ